MYKKTLITLEYARTMRFLLPPAPVINSSKVCWILTMYFCGLYGRFHVSRRQIPPMTDVMTKYEEGEDEGKEGDERTSRGDTERANILPPPPHNDIKRKMTTLDIDDLATGQRTRWRFSFSPCSQAQLAGPGISETLLIQTTVKKWGKPQADDTKWTVSAFFIKEKPPTSVGK